MPVTEREKLLQFGVSRWWKFDQYAIEDGYIRPAPGASLGAFDPWTAHQDGATPPYIQLVRLVSELPRDPLVKHHDASGELRSGVLDWCRRNGLLGLLLHEVSSARLGDWAVQRGSTGWSQSYFPWEPGPYEPPWGEVFGESVIGEHFYQSEDYWKKFFPGRVDGFQMLPLSDEFWSAYAEPFDDFLRVARWFANAIDAVGAPEDSPVIEQEELKSKTGKIHRQEVRLDQSGAIDRLNRLSSGVTPVVTLNHKDYGQSWRSHSMLGYLAMQALQDLLGGERILLCAHCGHTFRSAHHSARFCSKLCANRQHQREHRKRNKRKKSAGNRGKRKIGRRRGR
jgi:predicted RNA-binding Zn ribbon-like protein